ncbi:hypothetical protein CFIO01_07784 [Colletotrichum fioriniae PJ7]|uniref:Uncharacterized protein n=1 Tax=Colletotrichum fioriniae PJ7 TaxID=1445577 RepID=A0A010RT73_9PEZI|nr:hypothetical protein CFIO01_07784 [Colletotrichum fioriniae PJ7]
MNEYDPSFSAHDFAAKVSTPGTRGPYPANGQNREAAALRQQRFATFEAEPLEAGNRLVLLPTQTGDVKIAEEAHRQRVSATLESL